jgi:hypothetical protein
MCLRLKDRDQLADDAHGGQDHDVDRRVRVEPEEVLVEHRVAAEGRGRRCRCRRPLGDEQQQRDASTGVASIWMMAVA